jgi:hypothetical protein
MSKRPLPLEEEVSHHLLTIQSKIEKMAELAGVSAEDRLSIERVLEALPQPERRRVRLFLQGVQAQSDDEAVQQAAEGFLLIASRVWGR